MREMRYFGVYLSSKDEKSDWTSLYRSVSTHRLFETSRQPTKFNKWNWSKRHAHFSSPKLRLLKISKLNKEQVVPDPAERKTESAEEVTTIAYARNVSYSLFCVVNRRYPLVLKITALQTILLSFRSPRYSLPEPKIRIIQSSNPHSKADSAFQWFVIYC